MNLIKRGEVIFDTDFLSNWQPELVEMNRKKKGAKYRYPNSLIWLLLATVHVYLLPYRQLEGFLNVMSKHIPRLKEKVPDYTTMWWSCKNKGSVETRNKSKRKRRHTNNSSWFQLPAAFKTYRHSSTNMESRNKRRVSYQRYRDKETWHSKLYKTISSRIAIHSF